jgi:hypothetical protein
VDFVGRRLEQLLVDRGCCIEAVKAVLSEQGACPATAALSAQELQARSPTTPLFIARPLPLLRPALDTRPTQLRVPAPAAAACIPRH